MERSVRGGRRRPQSYSSSLHIFQVDILVRGRARRKAHLQLGSRQAEAELGKCNASEGNLARLVMDTNAGPSSSAGQSTSKRRRGIDPDYARGRSAHVAIPVREL